MKNWTLDDIQWDLFDPARLDPKIIPVIKTAAVVEYNGLHYADYLHNIFNDDSGFKEIATYWAKEEVQHGEALGKWASLADPSFTLERVFKKFSDGYKLPLDQMVSVRGSRAGELISRCIVETGTSSFYTALSESTEEPVLKQIAKKIAADEFRHYKLFYDYFKRYNEHDKLNLPQRLWIAVKRILESSDDELSYAYYAANDLQTPYDRKAAKNAYAKVSYEFYEPRHIDRVISMALKPVGLNPHGWFSKFATFFFVRFLNWQKTH